MKKDKLSIIMPMYNSTDIEKDLLDVSKKVEAMNNNYEIILVDDGSKNSCFNEAKKLKHPKIKVIGYKLNKGKGNALKFGFNFSDGEYIIFLDTGGDLDATQIKNFLKILYESHSDVVIGSKKHPKSIVHYPFFRKIMSKIYQTINLLLFGLNIKDTQVGLKLFRREVLEKVMPKIIVKRFAFDLELLVIINKLGYKIVEAPIKLEYNFKSTIKPSAVISMLWDTLAIFYRLKILRWYQLNEKK